MNDALNRQLILGHEGRRLVAYHDTEGFLTIADGFNLEMDSAPIICEKLGINYEAIYHGAPLTDAECDTLFTYNYGKVVSDVISMFPNFQSMPAKAVAVICDMRYELGPAGFREFHNFIAAVQSANWSAAVAAMWDSKWAKQVPSRVADDASLLESL